MDIRQISEAEKRIYIDKVKLLFSDIRNFLDTVEVDMEDKDLMIQASAAWLGGNLYSWFSDFMQQIKEIDQTQKSLNAIKTEIKEIVDGNSDTTTH